MPGILPITRFPQVTRFAKRCGASIPDWLEHRFDGLEDNPETRKLISAAVAIEQVHTLQRHGVDQFHFYTLNRSELTYAICHALGVRPQRSTARLAQWLSRSRQQSRARRLRQLFAERIVILDGAMGTMIQQHKLDEAAFRGERFKDWPRDLKGCNDLLVLTSPSSSRTSTAQFLEAGADIVDTNTFNATSLSLADYHLEELVYELNCEAVKLARRVADARIEEAGPHRVSWPARWGRPASTASISPDVNDPGYRAVTFDRARGDLQRGHARRSSRAAPMPSSSKPSSTR